MPSRVKNIIGKKFKRLTIVGFAGTDYRGITKKHSKTSLWYCVCSCNPNIIVGPYALTNLKNGHRCSCGCLEKENKFKKGCNKKYNRIESITDTVLKVYIDDSLYFLCNKNDWYAKKCYNYYWKTNDKQEGRNYITAKNEEDKKIFFHRYIMDCPSNLQVDHINGNVFDNRVENLRIVTKNDNLANLKIRKNNQSGVTGVGKVETGWRARITRNKKVYDLGTYDNFEDAVDARRRAEEVLQKEYSAINSRGEENLKKPLSLEEIVQNIMEDNL